MTQTYKVQVSMNNAHIVESGFVWKQGDFGFNIEIEVLDFDTTGATPQIIFRKSTGAVEATQISVVDNKFTYAIRGTELDTPGPCVCDLKLNDSTTKRVSTASFKYFVIPDTMDGLEQEASSYSDTIEQIVNGFDDAISSISNALNDYKNDILNLGAIIKNQYVKIDGVIDNYNGWDRTDYIPVYEYDSLTIMSSVGSAYNAFYDSSKTFIRSFSYNTSNTVVTIPENAKYMILSNTATGLSNTVGTFTRRLDNEVNEHKNAIIYNDGVYPFINIDEWTNNSYINASTGVFTAEGTFHRSDYIEIGVTDQGILHFDNTKGSTALYNCFYDANHAKVGNNFDTNNKDIEIPDGAVYFAVSIEKGYFVSVKKPITKLIERAKKAEVTAVIDKYNKSELIFSIITGSYVDHSTGEFRPYSGWDRTDYISVINYNELIVHYDGTSSRYNAFYDSSKAFINSFTITQGKNIVEIPMTASFVVFSGEDDYIETIKVIKGAGTSNNGIINGNAFMQDECLSLRNSLPSYYTSYPQSASSYNDGAYIDVKAGEVSLQDKNFIFITDVHWPSNARKSNQLIAYLRKKLHISNVVHGGDVLDYDQDDPELASVHMREWIDEARAAAGSGLLPVQGNHDVNTGSGRTDEQTEADIMPYAVAEKIQLDGSKPFIVQETDAQIRARIASITFDTTADENDVIAYYKLHYYYDDNKNKIRYIILNHGTHLNGIIHKYFNVRQFGEVFLQMDWLYETLMNTPNDYTVVVAMHTFINWGNNLVQSGPFHVCSMLRGFKLKESNCRITNANEISGTVYPYGYHYYDFSNANSPAGIICLGGDMHWDYAKVLTAANGEEWGNHDYTDQLAQNADAIVVVHTQTDAYGRTYAPGTYITDTWPMTQGTTTEQCFDIVSITEPVNGIRTAKFTRIGAGYDRQFILS